MLMINISELRANLLKHLEKARQGEQITVSSDGKTLATIIPPVEKKENAKRRLVELAATAKFNDVTRPLDAEWDALQ